MDNLIKEIIGCIKQDKYKYTNIHVHAVLENLSLALNTHIHAILENLFLASHIPTCIDYILFKKISNTHTHSQSLS